jgi:hypothetical protein
MVGTARVLVASLTFVAGCAFDGGGAPCPAARCAAGGSPDGGTTTGPSPDAAPGRPDAAREIDPIDAAPDDGIAALRITEINVAGTIDLVELVAVAPGALDGLRLEERTNSGLDVALPSGYALDDGDVLVVHVGGRCTDPPDDPAACGDDAPWSAAAYDLSVAGGMSYSGKVLVVLGADGAVVDGVAFVESHGVAPASYVAAVEGLQAIGAWDPTTCVDDASTGKAEDRYCRNVSVLWDGLSADGSSSVTRIVGGAPLTTPGHAAQWSAALPATLGAY